MVVDMENHIVVPFYFYIISGQLMLFGSETDAALMPLMWSVL